MAKRTHSWIGAGIAAIILPQLLHVKEDKNSRNTSTATLTIGVYCLAVLATVGMEKP